MKLYDVTGSPNCARVRILARELGLPLELVPIDISQPKAPAYLAQNPTGKVPTLIDDDGFALWESAAILIHLAEKRPESRLMPQEPHARAEVMRWLFFAATHLQPWLSLLGQERILKARSGQPADPATVALAERELRRFLPVIEQRLAGRDYLADDFSIADIAVGCTLEGSESRGIELSVYARIVHWRERLRQRPSWRS